MNSYNDNLHSSVVSSLLAQSTALKISKANLSASTYKLFFAEGAKIKAQQKLDDDLEQYNFQRRIKEAAVLNNNMVVNVDATSQDQKVHTALSVTNVSVCAANVQAAANSILRLASNVGSIYSIMGAANYDSEIYSQGEQANRLMGFTAYEAEKASQLSMEASALTAKVSAGTVADMASVAKKGVANILSVTEADFNAISTKVATDNTDLATANDQEKQAEGEVEFNNVDFFAAQSAYLINNRELNQNLRVYDIDPNGTYFNVAFDFYHSPFKYPKSETDDDGNTSISAGYPVKTYYLMVVKDSNKSIFSVSNAEALTVMGDRHIEIPADPQRLGQRYLEQKVYLSDLNDSDGDGLEHGQKYVVFVLAVFVEEYKKLINNFDDFLTAPSSMFTLTNKLASPKPAEITISKTVNSELDFEVIENKNFQVEYRCLLLPDKTDLIAGLLTESGLRKLEKEIQVRERIADKFVPLITKLEADILTYRDQLEGIKERQREIRMEEKDPATKPDTLVKLQKEYEQNQTKSVDIHARQVEAQKKHAELKAEQKKAVKKLLVQERTRPGFFFNEDLASRISASNYLVAVPNTDAKAKDLKEKLPANYGVRHMKVSFQEDTNDVFGNKIEKNVKYIPAIFSVSTALVENQDQFVNSLSDFEKTKPVTNILPDDKK